MSALNNLYGRVPSRMQNILISLYGLYWQRRRFSGVFKDEFVLVVVSFFILTVGVFGFEFEVEFDLGVPGSSKFLLSYHLFLADEFHRFFTAFSLLPGTCNYQNIENRLPCQCFCFQNYTTNRKNNLTNLAISDHLLPLCFCISKMISSSSGVQSPFFTDGSK